MRLMMTKRFNMIIFQDNDDDDDDDDDDNDGTDDIDSR